MRRPLSTLLIPLLLVAAPVSAKAKKPENKTATMTPAAKPVDATDNATVLHRHEYEIAFDPHPTQYEPLGKKPVLVDGKWVSYRVELQETWSGDATPVLQELGAKVTVFVDKQPRALLLFPKTRVDASRATKGLVLDQQRSGTLGARVVVTSPRVDNKRLIAVTVATELLSFPDASPAATATLATETVTTPPPDTGPTEVFEAAEPGSIPVDTDPSERPTTGKSLTAISMARNLVARAGAMTSPATQAARTQLLQRALRVLGDARDPEALALSAEIREQMDGAPGLPGKDAPGAPTPAPDPASPAAGTGTPTDVVPAATTTTTRPEVNTSSIQPMRAEVKALLDQAESKFFAGNDKDGFDLMHQATWKDPTCHEAWVRLGRKAYSVQEYKEARDAFDRAVALKSDDADSALMSVKAGVFIADEGGSIDQLTRMVQQHPDKVAVRLALAEAFYFAANYSSCESQCLQILEKFPGNARALELLNKTRDRTR